MIQMPTPGENPVQKLRIRWSNSEIESKGAGQEERNKKYIF